MSTRKSMKLPIVITLIMIIIVVYLFATVQQESVTCEKSTTYDNGVKLNESVKTTIDGDSISSIHLEKHITLPSIYLNDESYRNGLKYSLENTLNYLGKKVKYLVTSDGVVVTIDVSKNELVLLDNIDFDGDGDLGLEINTNTVSGDVVTMKVGDKYSVGDLKKKLKNNSYMCR